MALETLSSTELLNFIIYDTISATPSLFNNLSTTYESSHTTNTPSHALLEHNILNDIKPPLLPPPLTISGSSSSLENTTTITTTAAAAATITNSSLMHQTSIGTKDGGGGGGSGDKNKANLAVQGRKKRRRRPRVCKNKEEAETQRMTHIAVERNRRKQMNEHLAVLRSLMPESYVQRGDQASIVGGAIEFVKELEHLLQTLEAQKLQQLQQEATLGLLSNKKLEEDPNENSKTTPQQEQNNPPFAQFFLYPQYTWSQTPHKYTSTTKAAIADIEVTLIETHANLRILSRKSPRELSRLVAGFQTLHMTILHLNVTTMDPLVLYSISAKIEEGCQLTSVDDIAGAVHHMLRIIEEEDAIC